MYAEHTELNELDDQEEEYPSDVSEHDLVEMLTECVAVLILRNNKDRTKIDSMI